MSKLVPNITGTARAFRAAPMFGTWSENHTSVCLSTPALVLEVSKQIPRARLFADKRMIQFAGGPWFIQAFKEEVKKPLEALLDLQIRANIGDVEAKDLFSYRTCNVDLVFLQDNVPNPIALQIVQKARLFAIVDEQLEIQIARL